MLRRSPYMSSPDSSLQLEPSSSNDSSWSELSPVTTISHSEFLHGSKVEFIATDLSKKRSASTMRDAAASLAAAPSSESTLEESPSLASTAANLSEDVVDSEIGGCGSSAETNQCAGYDTIRGHRSCKVRVPKTTERCVICGPRHYDNARYPAKKLRKYKRKAKIAAQQSINDPQSCIDSQERSTPGQSLIAAATLPSSHEEKEESLDVECLGYSPTPETKYICKVTWSFMQSNSDKKMRCKKCSNNYQAALTRQKRKAEKLQLIAQTGSSMEGEKDKNCEGYVTIEGKTAVCPVGESWSSKRYSSRERCPTCSKLHHNARRARRKREKRQQSKSTPQTSIGVQNKFPPGNL